MFKIGVKLNAVLLKIKSAFNINILLTIINRYGQKEKRSIH